MVPCDYTMCKAINNKVEWNQLLGKTRILLCDLVLEARAGHVNLFCTDQELVTTLTQLGFEYFFLPDKWHREKNDKANA